jgi:hypothetical protein
MTFFPFGGKPGDEVWAYVKQTAPGEPVGLVLDEVALDFPGWEAVKCF